ncbi:MAG: hypothetical protein GF401_02175 [Chitinivibrionales bacterium]|nr:hypothetical protein [Chitinivibrionales bacterium]
MITKIIYCTLFLTVFSASLHAVPSYLWYATHSIEDYSVNGSCGWLDPMKPHDEADGFAAAVQGHNITNSWLRYNRRDSECTAFRWSGTSAETNNVDFLFYSGHGWGDGPYLGCNGAYLITCWIDIQFGGSGYLKWVQASACEWFVDEMYDRAGSGLNEHERWGPAFKGVHAVQGHRAATYDHNYSNEISDEFWDRWVDNGESLYWSWRQAQIHWIYTVTGYPGLQPATGAANSTYGYETWAAAGNEMAPDGMGWLGWATVGDPDY